MALTATPRYEAYGHGWAFDEKRGKKNSYECHTQSVYLDATDAQDASELLGISSDQLGTRSVQILTTIHLQPDDEASEANVVAFREWSEYCMNNHIEFRRYEGVAVVGDVKGYPRNCIVSVSGKQPAQISKARGGAAAFFGQALVFMYDYGRLAPVIRYSMYKNVTVPKYGNTNCGEFGKCNIWQ